MLALPGGGGTHDSHPDNDQEARDLRSPDGITDLAINEGGECGSVLTPGAFPVDWMWR